MSVAVCQQNLSQKLPVLSMFLSMFSFCNCDEPERKYHFDDDTFPSIDQIWGMVGTVVTTLACWLIYSRVKRRSARPSPASSSEQRNIRAEDDSAHHQYHHKAKVSNVRRTHLQIRPDLRKI